MMRTPLSKWLNLAGTYESLLIDQKKRGALKRKAADVKVGPHKHASGRHSDGEKVYLAVQVGAGELKGTLIFANLKDTLCVCVVRMTCNNRGHLPLLRLR